MFDGKRIIRGVPMRPNIMGGHHGKPVKIDIKEAPKSPPPPKPKDK